MSQDLEEKYVYFNVGLLKNSFGLDALWQDALKYHMIDQPGKLIAFRLTEYYEMMARGVLHPGPSVNAPSNRQWRRQRGDDGSKLSRIQWHSSYDRSSG